MAVDKNKSWNRHEKRKRLTRNRRAVLSRHGLTPEAFDTLLDRQGGKCAVCYEFLTKPKIDHDHDTGKTRSLLCNGCNSGLGFFQDDPTVIESALIYLLLHNKNKPNKDQHP